MGLVSSSTSWPSPSPPRLGHRPGSDRTVVDEGDQQPGRGEESGVAHHAVVGADRAGLDVPGPAQDLERLGHAEAALRPWRRAAGQSG